jgi:hypothetical protein
VHIEVSARTTPKRRPVIDLAIPFLVAVLSTLAPAPSAPPSALTGRVVDSAGVPVSRAYVRIVDASGKTADGVFSDADGSRSSTPAAASKSR